MRSVFVIIALILGGGLVGTACSERGGTSDHHRIGNLVLGKSRPSELFAQYGNPNFSYKPMGRSQAEVHQFSNRANEAFQVEDGRLVAQFRDPSGEEGTLQYWRHLWRGKDQVYEEIPGSRNIHGQGQFVLNCISEKTSVVYDSARGDVVRVVHYGK